MEFYKNQLDSKKIDKNKKNPIPDEFLDPLLCEPIKNPVYLPGTETIMEKTSIKRYLLEKQENPFDRSPLTLDEIERYNETKIVKDKIEEFQNKFNKWCLDNNYIEYQ